MRQAPDQLLIFVAFSGLVDVTNNACERDLWPAVVQRKVTNGYRARWAAQGEVDVRTVVATAALQTKATPSSLCSPPSSPDQS
jgi:transposase